MSNTEDEQWELKIFGQSLTATKISMLVVAVSTVVGLMWSGFQVWHKIDSYEAPDMEAFEKRLSLVEESTAKVNDYTRDIKNDIKNDVRRLEKVVEQVERDGKVMAREVDRDLREMRKETDNKIRRALDNPLLIKEQ